MVFKSGEVGRALENRAQQQIQALQCVNSGTIRLIRRWSVIVPEISSSTVEVDHIDKFVAIAQSHDQV